MKIAYLMYVHYVSLFIQIWMDLIENLYYLHYIHNVDSTHDTSANILPPPSQCCFPMLNFEKKYRSEMFYAPYRVHPYDT